MTLGSARLVGFGAITDAARAKQFYVDALGLTTRHEDDFALVLDANGVELRLQKVPAITPSGFTTLGWEVRELDGVLDLLIARGVAMERYSWLTQDSRGVWLAPGGARVAWFKDPDGNLLSVAQYPRA